MEPIEFITLQSTGEAERIVRIAKGPSVNPASPYTHLLRRSGTAGGSTLLTANDTTVTGWTFSDEGAAS
jgi:hypothetical protein